MYLYLCAFYCSICRRYDEMAEKVSDVPDTTEEIVGLQEYLKTVSQIQITHRYMSLYHLIEKHTLGLL